MPTLKREQWILIAVAVAVAAVYYFARKRGVRVTTAIPTGQGSLIGSTLAGQTSIADPSTLPVVVTLPIGPTSPTLGASNGGNIAVALGGPAVSNTGILPPLTLKQWYGGNGTPIYSPRQPAPAL